MGGRPTLLLLRHLVRAASGPVLLLATFRDADVDMSEAFAHALADLRRSDDVARVRLTGLSGDDVIEFIERAGEGRVGADLPELASAISELTSGNPFLMCEFWRALCETEVVEVAAGLIRLTRSARRVWGRRRASVRSSATDCRGSRPRPGFCLNLAATAGREFELDIVRRGTGLDEEDLLGALDEAVRSGLVEELPERRLAYRFTHELVRRARLRSALGGAPSRAAPARRGVPRSRPAVGRSARSLTSHIISPPPRRSAKRAARSTTTCLPLGPRSRRSPSIRRQEPPRYGAGAGDRRPGAAVRGADRARWCTAASGPGARRVGRSALGRGSGA